MLLDIDDNEHKVLLGMLDQSINPKKTKNFQLIAKVLILGLLL